MKFRKAGNKDINGIMRIINQAQEYFREQGIDQWQGNYPNIEIIKNDIENNNNYILVEDDNVIATVVVCFGREKNYDNIYDGTWISDNPYVSIHRIAVDQDYKGRGVSSKIIKNVEKICLDNGIHSIRVDTHEENLSMQRLLKKNEFQYCGVIYLEDNSKRIAFEKII